METEKLDIDKKPQFSNILVIILWIIMFTLNLSTLFMEDGKPLDEVTHAFAYTIAFGLAGYVAGIHLFKFIANRRWNKMVNDAKPIPEDSPLNDIIDFMEGKSVEGINNGLPKTHKAPPMPRTKPPKRSEEE